MARVLFQGAFAKEMVLHGADYSTDIERIKESRVP